MVFVASPAFFDTKWRMAILSHGKSGIVLKLWHVNANRVHVMGLNILSYPMVVLGLCHSLLSTVSLH